MSAAILEHLTTCEDADAYSASRTTVRRGVNDKGRQQVRIYFSEYPHLERRFSTQMEYPLPTYKIEYHRVWRHTVYAESREQARQIVEDGMSEEPDAEDYNYSIVRKQQLDRDSGGEGHNSAWGS